MSKAMLQKLKVFILLKAFLTWMWHQSIFYKDMNRKIADFSGLLHIAKQQRTVFKDIIKARQQRKEYRGQHQQRRNNGPKEI